MVSETGCAVVVQSPGMIGQPGEGRGEVSSDSDCGWRNGRPVRHESVDGAGWVEVVPRGFLAME